MKKELSIKAKFFIELLQDIPYGSNKMTTPYKEEEVYAEVLKERNREMLRRNAEEAYKIAMDWIYKGTKAENEMTYEYWMDCNEGNLDCAIAAIRQAEKEFNEAKKWLEENGYIRIWKKQIRATMYKNYYGVTSKGWAVADKYLALVG